jgi:hypothetical protein
MQYLHHVIIQEFARIFDIGGPQWLVGVLVEKMASQVKLCQ